MVRKRVMYDTTYQDARLRDEPVDGDVQGRRERPSVTEPRAKREVFAERSQCARQGFSPEGLRPRGREGPGMGPRKPATELRGLHRERRETPKLARMQVGLVVRVVLNCQRVQF